MGLITPDIILGGAPKCGTSSLFNWLAEHPDIMGSRPKEPFYLMDEDHPLLNSEKNIYNRGWEAYSDLFRGAEKKRLYMEGSTHYLYQQHTPQHLSKLKNRPKVVFILRNPVDRFYSSYLYSKNNLASIDPDIEFETIARAQLNKEPITIADNPSGYVLSRDLDYGNYEKYLRHWFEHYPRKLVKVLFFEDLKNDPKTVLRDTFKYLGLNFNPESLVLSEKNKTKAIRNKQLHRRLKAINKLLPRSGWVNKVKNYYFRMQAQEQTEQMSEALYKELKEYYRPLNEKLEKLLGVELSNW